MPLTNDQLHEIRRIIRDYHTAFIVNTIGVDAVAPDILEELKARGLVDAQISSIEDAYIYGQLLEQTKDPAVAKMSYEDFKEYIKKNPIPLNDVERRAVQFSQQSAAQFVVGLGNTVDKTTGYLMIEADAKLRAETRKKIQDATAENIAKRQSIQQLKKELGWATKDWSRDWGRIAVTEKHSAMQRGVADGIAKVHGDEALVAKRPTPDACDHCKRLYLGPDGHPRIFSLAELEANGPNNFGRKAADWLPVIGATHPHCQCQLIRIPAGWGFTVEGTLEPGGEGGVRSSTGDGDDGILTKSTPGKERKGDSRYQGLLSLDIIQVVHREQAFQKSLRVASRCKFQGLTIAIENPVGTTRTWTEDDGSTGSVEMTHAYGYIEGTEGGDGEEIDVYVGPDPHAANVFVIHQQNPRTGVYDEDKVMLGFSNEQHAREVYDHHYTRNDFRVSISAMDIDHFKRWIANTKPETKVLEKSDNHRTDGERFVILEKSHPAADSPAGNRNPSLLGTGANYITRTPEHERFHIQELSPSPREVLDAYNHVVEAEGGTDARRESWEFSETLGAGEWASRFELADTNPYGVQIADDEIDSNRKFFLDAINRTVEGYRNHADLEKSITPIGGITPSGYKKVAKDKYVKPGEEGKSHIVTGTFKRQGELELADIKTLKKPKVHDKYVQSGDVVSVKGKYEGKLMGYSHQGRPVVQYNGKQRTLQWSDVTRKGGPQEYRATFEKLSRSDAVVHATERQKRLTKEVLQFKVGDIPAQEYLDWFRERGNEVLLVGGIVRDLLAGTKPGANSSDGQVKEAMKDIDIAITSQPYQGVQAAVEKKDLDAPKGPFEAQKKQLAAKNVKLNSGWGVVQILDGVGLDVAAIAHKSGDDHTEFKGVYDHDIDDDVQRRDFTANTLFYDVYNDTITDPTGNGIADAQAMVLRLAPTVENAKKNETLPLRFWKFRARGWKADANTLKLMKEMLPKAQYSTIQWQLKKTLEKGDKKKIWDAYRDAMYADGAGKLYEDYIKPHKKKLVEWSVSEGGK